MRAIDQPPAPTQCRGSRRVSLRLPEAMWQQFRQIARERGLSLSELLGEAAAIAVFDAALARLRPTLEQPPALDP